MPRLTADQWSEIRARREAGESFPSLAQAFDVSHQAIQKRAAKENWGDGADVGATVRRKVAEKVAGVAGVTLEKKAQILEAAAEKGAALIRQQQQDWETHRRIFGEVPADFDTGKHAKISAEMLRIRHEGERAAYGLDEPGGGNSDVRIIIERQTAPLPPAALAGA